MTEAEEIFNKLVGEIDYSMLIVTTSAAGQRAGCLVGFATQCSIDPPRFLVCLSEKNRTFRVAEHSEALLVHFVAADSETLVELFGSVTGDDDDKFARCRWHTGPRGLPVLDDCPSWFAGEVLDRLALGDHRGYVLSPFAAVHQRSTAPFPFHRARLIEPGHPA
ncbi:MAG TPA: flavin reductase family protein [Solirubrobacteraceae bacterium]|jgi:flavin reductase (DIM6/NTAB) family NADH-FMN oxidoreductase RutF|nr:flavin reductase family protein [Solirubrobacteraceae bacterium]